MKKTILRIQGIGGGCEPIHRMMAKMVEAGIPFVLANSHRHTGSRRTLENWSPTADLLFVLVRDSDEALIRILNTECRIVEDDVWHVSTIWHCRNRGFIHFADAYSEAQRRHAIRIKRREEKNEKELLTRESLSRINTSS